MPGNLVLVNFVAAVIDMICDAGVTGGMSPPSSGWMDEYIKAVVGGGGVVSAVDDAENPTESCAATEGATPAPPAPIAIPADAVTAIAATDNLTGVRRSSRQRLKTSKSSTETTIVTTAVATGSPRNSPWTGSPSTSSSPRSRGASPGYKKHVSFPSVWVRPDVRDETAVLTKYLIERHMKSLKANFSIEKESTREVAMIISVMGLSL